MYSHDVVQFSNGMQINVSSTMNQNTTFLLKSMKIQSRSSYFNSVESEWK